MAHSDPLRETLEFEATRDALRRAVGATLPESTIVNSRREQQRRLRDMPRFLRRSGR